MSMKSLCAAVLTTSSADGATFDLLPDAQAKLPKSGLLGPVRIYSRKIEGR
jgi:hypothetical protein